MNTTKDIATAIQAASKQKTKAYDTTATVTRIEGNTAWVHIPSGVNETPVAMTIDAKAGDTVQVRIANGRAWLTGNASAPPTDDTTAKQAQDTADTAKDRIDKQQEHFWYDDQGAHVEGSTGYRTDLKSTGMYVVNSNTGDVVASFGQVAKVGEVSSTHISVDSNSIDFYNGTENAANLLATIKENGGDPLIEIANTNGNSAQIGATSAFFQSASNSGGLSAGDLYLGDVNITDASDATDMILDISDTYAHSPASFTFDGGKTDDHARLWVNNAKGSLWTGFGTGGYAHGVYSDNYSMWIIELDTSGYARIPAIPTLTTSSAANVFVGSAGRLAESSSSSERYKRDIKDIGDDAEKLYDVRVVQFVYKDDYLDPDDERYGKTVGGFIAEELDKVYPIAVEHREGKPEDWNHRYIIPPMLKLIQNQHDEIEELKRRLDKLENER